MLSWEYPPRVIGGLARVVAALSQEIALNNEWEVHVVTADHPGTLEHSMDKKVHVHRVKTQTDTTPDFLTWVGKLNFGLLQYAIKLHLEQPFDIVHAHDWMVTDAAWVLKSGFGIPFIATIHATEAGRMHGIHSDMQHYIHQLEWRLTFEAWKVIVNSKSMVSELQNLFKLPTDKLAVIPNGTDPFQFDFDFDPESIRGNFAAPHEPIVLYVGRVVNEKGVQVLLDAMPAMLSEFPSARLLIVGTGYYLDAMKAKAYENGIAQFVTFLGYISDDDLKKLYKIADIVCIPSLYEPFGIVALEGMAAQVPVVTSDAGGLTDFVEHGVNGITTYAGDASSLAWGLLEVLRNPELADRLKADAYTKVKNIYNWKKIAERTLSVYEEVLTESAREKKKVSQSKVQVEKVIEVIK
jgi:glycosyltransferase involved in cell wall biosynthesis